MASNSRVQPCSPWLPPGTVDVADEARTPVVANRVVDRHLLPLLLLRVTAASLPRRRYVMAIAGRHWGAARLSVKRGRLIGEPRRSIGDLTVTAGLPAARQMAFMPTCRRCGGVWGSAGTAILRANVLSMAAGTVGAWWTGRLSVFWRAQIVGWGLFVRRRSVNRLLTYRDVEVALAHHAAGHALPGRALRRHARGLCVARLRQPADPARASR